MDYNKAKAVQKVMCDQFFFNRKQVDVFAGGYDDEPEPKELVYEIFSEVLAINVILVNDSVYALELLTSSDDLYITPIVDYFNLNQGDIIATHSDFVVLQTRKRPLEIGCSVGPLIESWRGTLGCFVKDMDSNDNYLLSNHHVLFSEQDYKENFIAQPSTFDGGKQNDVIGLYVRSLAPDTGKVNHFDAAVAGPLSAEFSNLIPEIDIKINETIEPAIGMKVYKIGATTGKTFGIITSIDTVLKIPDFKKNLLDYENQISIVGTQKDFLTLGNFSKAGDSGSVVFDYDSNKVVGLLFCGNGKSNSFANKINPLFHALRISLK